MRSFLTLLEQSRYEPGSGGVLLWTAWRTCPHSSWYGGVDVTDGAADCVQFAAPGGYDPPEYKKLWQVTSAPGVKDGIKDVLKDFVHSS